MTVATNTDSGLTYTHADVVAMLDRLGADLQSRRFDILESSMTKFSLGMADGLTVATALIDREIFKLGTERSEVAQ